MRNIFILALITILMASCSDGYTSLHDAEAKVKKCVSLTTGSIESDHQISVNMNGTKTPASEEADTPSPNFIWDSKMIFW